MTKNETGYELTVEDRISLLQILPAEGNFATLRIVRKLREALSFSEAEVRELKFRQPGQIRPEDDDKPADQQQRVAEGAIAWLVAADPRKRFQFGAATLTIIREALTKLETAGKLREQHMGLYEQFVGGDSNDVTL